MIGINARVDDLREQLIKDLNDAQMPVCILDYVVTEILNDIRAKRIGAVQKERQRDREEKGLTTVERHGDTIVETAAPKVEKRMSAPLPVPDQKEGE